MSGDELRPSFVDTNVFVYALSGLDPKRSLIAQGLVSELIASGALSTSTQVLQELFVTVTRKVRPAVTPEHALRYMDRIATSRVTVLDYASVRAAVELSLTASLSFWDALILVAASRSGASRLYTEDLNHGQTILGVEVINPFVDSPPSPRPD